VNACLCSSEHCRVNGCAARGVKLTGAAQPDLTGVRRVQIGGSKIGAPLGGPVFRGMLPVTPAPKPMRTGWECPRCQTILAPHVDRCTCKVPG
jgi:hypothetical protein